MRIFVAVEMIFRESRMLHVASAVTWDSVRKNYNAHTLCIGTLFYHFLYLRLCESNVVT